MEIKDDNECEGVIDKLDKGINPERIDAVISYLDKTDNQKFSLKLIKYLHRMNMAARANAWTIQSKLMQIDKDIQKIKKHLEIE